MPTNPFSTLPLPIGDDARERDARPQRSFKPPSRELSTSTRDEPLRAEDALKQRGLNRPLSSLMSDVKERIGKDRDGIVRDKDGIMRLTDSALTYQSPPRRTNPNGLSFELLEKDREKISLSMLGGMGLKRDREDDEGSSKTDKKKRHHHHHHPHPHPHPHTQSVLAPLPRFSLLLTVCASILAISAITTITTRTSLLPVAWNHPR